MKTRLHVLIAAFIMHTGTVANAQCTGGNQYANQGFVNDGGTQTNYTNNENCSWLLESAMGGTIYLGFYNFITEGSLDVLRIYDGADANAPLLAEYSGGSAGVVPAGVQTTGKYMYITWVTDYSITYLGWDAWWRSSYAFSDACVGSISDGYNNYENDQTLSWLIQPAGAESINFNLSSMDLETCCDYVRIYDGVDASAPLLGEYNGTTTANVTSTGGSLFVQFTSDGSVTAGGFYGSYSCTTCSGLTTLTAPSGFVSDGSDGGSYGNGANCSWLIQPQDATSIQIDFSGWELENCCDFVRVYDGVNANAPLLATVSSWNQSITTTTGAAFVQFTTDGSATFGGWEFFYEAFLPCAAGNDATPPVANCAAAFEVSASQGNAAQLNVGMLNNGSTDNCGIDNMSVSPTSLSASDQGFNTVTLSVQDLNGNTSTCTCQVYVINTTGIDEQLLAHMTIFPNPNNGSFRMDLSGADLSNGAQMDVMDNTGRIVYTKEVNQSINDLTLEGMAAGLYLVRINIGGAIASKHVVIN